MAMGFGFVILLATLVLAAAIIIPISIAVSRAVTNNNAPKLHSGATVVTKRSQATGGSSSTVREIYFATFELPDTQRIELNMTGQQYGQLVEGDQGTLFWQGTRYQGFKRNALPAGPQDRPRLGA